MAVSNIQATTKTMSGTTSAQKGRINGKKNLLPATFQPCKNSVIFFSNTSRPSLQLQQPRQQQQQQQPQQQPKQEEQQQQEEKGQDDEQEKQQQNQQMDDVPGNKKLLAIIKHQVKDYARAKFRAQKLAIISNIMYAIRLSCPNGSAFITYEDGSWWEIDEMTAREKISMIFRELLLKHQQQQEQRRRMSLSSISSARNAMLMQRRRSDTSLATVIEPESESSDSSSSSSSDEDSDSDDEEEVIIRR